MKLKDIISGVPLLSFSGNEEADIQGLFYSSKDVLPGGLFAALKGEKRDGHEFIEEALQKGALVILSEKPKPPSLGAGWVQVYDAREALALCAANFYDHPSQKMKLVGVTGTKGKTTVTYILESILQKAGFAPGVIGTISYRGPDFTFDAQRTTPEAPDLQRMLRDMADRGVTHCLMEVSSHALDLKRVWGISFDVSVFTNLSSEHLDYHQTLEDYFAAKKKLFFLNSKKRTAVVNQDDPWGLKLTNELPMSTITFGLEPNALVRGEKFRLNGLGIEALVKYPGGQTTVSSALSGKHNLYNILASFAVALALNIPPAVIREGIAALPSVPGRFERVENGLGLNIFVDYAHTDAALKSLLETAKELKPNRILLVFGAGGDRDRGKRPRMGEVAGLGADWIVLTSDNPRSEDPLAIIREIEAGVRRTGSRKYSIEPDRYKAIELALSLAKKGDAVLIAGKGHENYQVIGDKALPFHDATVIREILEKMESS